jgi:hypothetical protein
MGPAHSGDEGGGGVTRFTVLYLPDGRDVSGQTEGLVKSAQTLHELQRFR